MDVSSVLIATIVIAVLLLWFVVRTYNRLVGMRNSLRDAWSDVDVQLMLRHDLVPSLVESVKGYMTHERETLEAVARARSMVNRPAADLESRGAAELALSGALGNLLAVAERYPQLQASQNFLLLQERLTSTENRIAFARQHYNDSVRRYNTTIAEFPSSVVASLSGFCAERLFAAEAEDRAVVQAA